MSNLFNQKTQDTEQKNEPLPYNQDQRLKFSIYIILRHRIAIISPVEQEYYAVIILTLF